METGAPAGEIPDRRLIEDALRVRPDDPHLNHLLGMRLLAEGDAEQALDLFNLALYYAPGLFAACEGRARALAALGRQGERIKAYDDFLRANPGHTEAVFALAVAHDEQGRHEAAAALLEKHASPGADRRILNLLGLIVGRERGDLARGEALLRLALAEDPRWGPALCNLGWNLLEQGRYDEGMECIDQVLAQDPSNSEARYIRGCMNLKRGNFRDGWSDYAARHCSRLATPSPVEAPAWQGQVLSGTLLVHGEQGLGDEIMFASCVAQAAARAPRTVLACNPKLVPLFRRSFPGIRVLGMHERAALQKEQYEARVAIGDLAAFFRTDASQFPPHAGYLVADEAKTARMRARLDALGPGLKLGVSWRGGTWRTRVQLRSVPLERLKPLALPGVHLVSLQYGDVGNDLERAEGAGLKVVHWNDVLQDYDETAALVCALDLVVSVCTAVVHLSGALGRPAWVMVPATPEWRYMDSGDSMPWYPSVRLFRQQRPGAWDEVIRAVALELGGLLGAE